MDKRVILVSPNGGAEVEVYESSSEYMISKGWKRKTEKTARSNKGVKNG